MITRFLASKFSGYLAIAAIAFLLLGAWYIHHKGYKSCERDAQAKELTNQVQTTKDRREDERQVQSLERDSVINELRSRDELRND